MQSSLVRRLLFMTLFVHECPLRRPRNICSCSQVDSNINFLEDIGIKNADYKFPPQFIDFSYLRAIFETMYPFPSTLQSQ